MLQAVGNSMIVRYSIAPAIVSSGTCKRISSGSLHNRKMDINTMDTDMEIVTIQQETCFIFCSSPAPKLRLKDNASPLFIPNAKSRVLDMTRGNPFRLVLKFALPLFFGNLLQQFYNLADTAIAGHVLGDHALAQIGAVS